MKKKEKLIPPDKKQCQCLRPNGNNFMTFGGVPGFVRCENKSTVIITEKKKAKDGQKGSMSLCNHCWNKAIEQLGENHFTVKPIIK